MPVKQSCRVHDEAGVGIPGDQVGVVADGDLALADQTRERSGEA